MVVVVAVVVVAMVMAMVMVVVAVVVIVMRLASDVRSAAGLSSVAGSSARRRSRAWNGMPTCREDLATAVADGGVRSSRGEIKFGS